MHDCGRFRWPSTNKEYWERKIYNNVERDHTNKEQLQSLGWKVLEIWECELKRKSFEETMSQIIQEICNR